MKDKVVIITGAAQGIGQAIAIEYAKNGARVAIFDIKEPTKTIKKIKKIGGETIWLNTNVTDEKQVQNSIAEVLAKWDRVDILVNNAGIFPKARFQDIKLEEFKRVYEINVFGTFICSKLVTNVFISKEIKGCIVNIASVAAFQPELYGAHYNSSKAAVKALTESMAFELGKYGIRVFGVAPGAILTPGTQELIPDIESGKIPQDMIEWEKKFVFTPMGHFGKPQDIANMVVFLTTDKARYITGTTFLVDGGRSIV